MAVRVDYHFKAVEELVKMCKKDARGMKAVLSIVDILSQTGADITMPHARAVQGTKKLWELRPGGGKILIRPLYVQTGSATFDILAVGPESEVDSAGFNSAVARAVKRAKADYGIDA
jgi:hypothetical protein